jgi:ferredoxin
MIFYFSGTGNSRYAAEELGRLLNVRTADMTDLKDNEINAAGEPTGIVWPVYWFGLPTVVRDLISQTRFNNLGKIFSVLTYGLEPGNASGMMKKECMKAGIDVTHLFEVKMPDNYVLMYDVPNEEEQTRILRDADTYIGNIPKLLEGDGYEEKRSLKKSLLTAAAYPYYRYGRNTRRFRTEGECTKCSVCERACPTNVIRITDNGPEWTTKKCIRCLACLHRCPSHVIQMGRSRKHGRYTNPNVIFDR